MFKLALLSLLALVHAAVTPTSPDGSTVVKVGSPINALWSKDTTAGTKWNNMQIQLMTGDNLNVSRLQLGLATFSCIMLIHHRWYPCRVSSEALNRAQKTILTGSAIATGVDGTSLDSYSFNAPNVSPYSKIYFLQL